jgi:hypothetical protein
MPYKQTANIRALPSYAEFNLRCGLSKTGTTYNLLRGYLKDYVFLLK